ncbi:MAG: spore coat U domain-containing protein [Idiomarina sp.]|nr:spore coat U domain-containing protein [Idiomarina sp.]
MSRIQQKVTFPVMALFGMLSIGIHGTAHACQVTDPNPQASYGTWSSIELETLTPVTSTQPSAGLECGSALLGVLGGLLFDTDYINATVTGTNTSGGLFHLRNPNGDEVPYRAFADPAFQEEINPGTTYNYSNEYLLELLGLLGTGNSAELPMLLRLENFGGVNLEPGVYTDTLTIFWDWRRCNGIDLLGLLCVLYSQGTATTTINVSMVVEPDCEIDAANANFGSAPLVGVFNQVTQTINIRCSKNQLYTVGLNNGLHDMSGDRRLSNGADYLLYDIFQGPSGDTPWAESGADRRASSAADISPAEHDGVVSQGFIYRAVIRPNQPTPPAGAYTDTIVIDVAF